MHQEFDSELNLGGVLDYLKEMFAYPFDIDVELTDTDSFKVEINEDKTKIFIDNKYSADYAFKLITYFMIKEILYDQFDDISDKKAYNMLEPIIDAFYKQYDGIMFQDKNTKRLN